MAQGPNSRRILFIITGNDPVGGAMIHVTHLAHRFSTDSVFPRVTRVLIGSSSVHSQALLASFGVDFRVIPDLGRPIRPGADLRALGQLRAEIRDFAPDLVSTHSSKAGILGRLAAHYEGVPAFFTAHGWAFTDGVSALQRFLYRNIERFFQRYSQRILCVSEFDRQLALRAGFRSDLLKTVHNGVPQEAGEPEPEVVEKFRAIPDRGFVRAAMVARLSAQKDHDLLFRALVRVPRLEVFLFGEGELLDQLRTLASTLGIQDRVHFMGYTRFVRWFLRSMDLFVLISHYEGFPRTTIEAMGQGLPVVVSRVGGSAEAFEEAISGLGVDRGDEEGVVRALTSLADDENLRRSLGAAALQRYQEFFTLDALVRRTLEEYP